MASALAMASGCVTIDATLDASGSATLEMVYGVDPATTEALERKRFASPDVTIDSLAIAHDGTAKVKLRVADPAKLSTIDLFRMVAITRQRDGDAERLSITVTNPAPKDVSNEGQPDLKIGVTLPGEVLEANRKATVTGNRVDWRLNLGEFLREKTTDLTVRYRVTPASDATSSKPAATRDEKKPAGK